MEEQELIRRLKAGDEDAKEELARAYGRKLYATASYFLGYRDPEVDDAVQDTYVSALRAIPNFEGRSSLYTWLNRICVNHCFSKVRKRKRLLATESEGLELLLSGNAREAAASAEAAAQDAGRLARLKVLLAKMGEPCASLLAWRYEGGLPLAEIRQKINAPLGTVASRLARCVAQLRKQALKLEGTV